MKMETKKKMEIKNGDRDKGNKEKVNNEAWFKAKIEGSGKHNYI